MNIINKTNISIDDFINTPIVNKEKEVIQDRMNHFYRMNHLSYVLDNTQISGMFCEFGVYRGITINSIAEKFPNNIVWGFDSFEGLPEDWITTDNEIIWPKGHFSVTDLPQVKNNVRLIKGWFNETLPTWVEKHASNISFLHIDCDLYSSTKTIFDSLNQYIVKDTIISFDEIYHFGNPKKYTKWYEGEFKALKEWLEEYDREAEIISRSQHMQSAIKVIR
jgi:hypothetical protein